jgi:hypothetical protein
MFLEDTQIGLPYSCHAITRSWLVHGFADQGARLYVGDTLASPSTLFQIDHHADHTHPESGARVGNLAHCAFSSAISGNARIFGGNPLIWNYQSKIFPGNRLMRKAPRCMLTTLLGSFSHGSLENRHSAWVPAGTRLSAGDAQVVDTGSSDRGTPMACHIAPVVRSSVPSRR